MAVLVSGCASQQVVAETPSPAAAVDPAIDPEAHALFTSQGDPLELSAFIAANADTDMIAFGEFHDHVVGSRIELELLEGLAAQDRPVALAMEFFEADQQADLDAYLAGEIDESQFVERTKRNDAYADSHRPLIELCKREGIPVIAANAPRRLVTAYRKSGLSYADWLQTITDEERSYLPASSVPPDDAFKARFMKLMGPKRGPAFYPSMALWNDAMAESMSRFREGHPEHRVLFIVGSFHVQAHLGTVTQYSARRPEDSTSVMTMFAPDGDPERFSSDAAGEGDAILQVAAPSE